MDRVGGCGLKHRTTGLVCRQRGAGLQTASVWARLPDRAWRGRMRAGAYGMRLKPSARTVQRPSFGKPGAGPSGAPSQPPAIVPTASSSDAFTGR